jgi:hypothetical protein
MRRLLSRKRALVVLALALVLVVPASVPRKAGLPPLVPEAKAGTSCRTITVYGKEKSTLGLTQYKLKQRNYWCSDGRKVTYWNVQQSVTWTAPLWSVRRSEANGWWEHWNGVFHGRRVEYREKVMEACVTSIGGCLKTKHPWIQVGMRADLGFELGWNTRDLVITRVEI